MFRKDGILQTAEGRARECHRSGPLMPCGSHVPAPMELLKFQISSSFTMGLFQVVSDKQFDESTTAMEVDQIFGRHMHNGNLLKKIS